MDGKYFYQENTGSSNLRKHLYKLHPSEYDAACEAYGWRNRRLEVSDGATLTNDLRRNVPPFSPTVFMEYLVRFIVADDQVRFTDRSLFLLRLPVSV
jgi:hypothetical protein